MARLSCPICSSHVKPIGTYIYFSLIIHEQKTKEIIAVNMCDKTHVDFHKILVTNFSA